MSDKIKFELEFPIQASSQLLYQYISTPSGLSEWFADDVMVKDKIFTFFWEGSEQEAKLLKLKRLIFLNILIFFLMRCWLLI